MPVFIKDTYRSYSFDVTLNYHYKIFNEFNLAVVLHSKISFTDLCFKKINKTPKNSLDS